MQTALIIGGSSGIGGALASELAKEADLEVIVVGRNLENLKKTQAKYPHKINYIVADISTTEGRESLLKQLPDKKLSFLVHNAATEAPAMSFEDITEEAWDINISTNLKAPFFLTQQLLIKNKLNDGARILFVSSGLDHIPMEGFSVYGPSKAALRHLVANLKEEKIIKDRDILLGVTNPGIVDTDMQKRLRESPENPTRKNFINFFAEGKLGQTEQVAQFISWSLLQAKKDEFTKTYWDLDQPEIIEHWQNSRSDIKR